MTLSFHEIGLRWPDAVVYWDRDVAPTLDWEPRFVVRLLGPGLSIEMPEATHPACVDRPWNSHATGRSCRCLLWDGAQWLPRYITTDEPVEWKREYLGQWFDEAQHFDNDTIRTIAYGAQHMWRTGHSALDEYREIARGRWPTLRRVLGGNEPR